MGITLFEWDTGASIFVSSATSAIPQINKPMLVGALKVRIN